MKIFALLVVMISLYGSLSLSGCAPRTPAEKAKDKVEDAAHETGQSLERAGERIKEKAK